MKIATFNVNGVNGHLPVLLRWLEESKPDVVCLQELKALQEKFRKRRSRTQAMGRSGMDRKAGMASPFSRAVHSPLKQDAGCRAIPMTPKAALRRAQAAMRKRDTSIAQLCAELGVTKPTLSQPHAYRRTDRSRQARP